MRAVVNNCDKYIESKRRELSLANPKAKINEDREAILHNAPEVVGKLYDRRRKEFEELERKFEENPEDMFEAIGTRQDEKKVRQHIMEIWSIDKEMCAGHLGGGVGVGSTPNYGAFSTPMLRVCDICGGLLSSLDTPDKLLGHMSGKMHQGYLKLRDFIEKHDKPGKKRKI